ncbi:MAG: 16S rRNA (cytidine(1402)-2'-O)-methyltransferase [Pseudomonadota bacterium]
MASKSVSAPPYRERGAPGDRPLEPALYLVATPIGTAADITLRALEVLQKADVLAAEDTRQARKLMDIHGVSLAGRPLVPYHDHNGAAQRPRLLAWLAEGRSIAYVSDAGTPLIADPGFQLARAAIEAGATVRTAPGASALLAALAVAGLPTDRFYFAGFLPPKATARRRALAELSKIPATLVFYEAPHRCAAVLTDMARELGGDRPAALCRELTKRFEEVRRHTLADLAEALAEEPDPKGEIVLVVGGAVARQATDEDIDEMLRDALSSLSVKDAASAVAEKTGAPRRDLYQRALALGNS